jgi:Putative beta barrel porin-7 (BBP7)
MMYLGKVCVLRKCSATGGSGGLSETGRPPGLSLAPRHGDNTQLIRTAGAIVIPRNTVKFPPLSRRYYNRRDRNITAPSGGGAGLFPDKSEVLHGCQESEAMKATIAALLVSLGSAAAACGQQPVSSGTGAAPSPGGARFYNAAPTVNPPLVGGLHIQDLTTPVAAPTSLPSAVLSVPSTPSPPGGARFLNPNTNANTPATPGPHFHDVLASPSHAGSPMPNATVISSNPILPFPQSAPSGNVPLPMPKPPIPPGTTPIVVDEEMPTFPDYGTPVFDAPLNEYSGRLPAIGPWGPRVQSGPHGPYLWFNADYLFWWVKNGPMPQPLVVTGPVTDEIPGALDQLNTTVLYGGQSIQYNPFSGARGSLGLWGGPEHRFGFEMGGFILEQKSTHYAGSGGATGNPFLARPFINAQTGFENVFFVSQNFDDPDRTALMTGRINISNTSRMWSWETNGLWNVWRGSWATANLIGGFRSVGLRERFNVIETLENLESGGGVLFAGASVDPGNTVTTFDKFDAENTFYGAQLGARFLLQHGRFSLNVSGKAALGVVQQLMVVDGGTVVRSGIKGSDGRGLVTGVAPGGILAQATNIGRHFQNKLAVVPEGAADFCFDVTDRLVVKLGYTFVYWSSVARPGDQIDRTINPAMVPTDIGYGTGGPARPAYPYKTTSVWTQGVNLGLEVRY